MLLTNNDVILTSESEEGVMKKMRSYFLYNLLQPQQYIFDCLWTIPNGWQGGISTPDYLVFLYLFSKSKISVPKYT